MVISQPLCPVVASLQSSLQSGALTVVSSHSPLSVFPFPVSPRLFLPIAPISTRSFLSTSLPVYIVLFIPPPPIQRFAYPSLTFSPAVSRTIPYSNGPTLAIILPRVTVPYRTLIFLNFPLFCPDYTVPCRTLFCSVPQFVPPLPYLTFIRLMYPSISNVL